MGAHRALVPSQFSAKPVTVWMQPHTEMSGNQLAVGCSLPDTLQMPGVGMGEARGIHSLCRKIK